MESVKETTKLMREGNAKHKFTKLLMWNVSQSVNSFSKTKSHRIFFKLPLGSIK